MPLLSRPTPLRLDVLALEEDAGGDAVEAADPRARRAAAGPALRLGAGGDEAIERAGFKPAAQPLGHRPRRRQRRRLGRVIARGAWPVAGGV